MPGRIIVSNMLLKEIPYVLGEIQRVICPSCFRTSEGELRNTALKSMSSLFKATIDDAPFGIISVDKGWITKINAWMKDGELKESWARAIQSAVQQIFFDPTVGKVQWRITESNKEMIEVAGACGFTKEGDLIGEGLNGEILVLMGLPRQKDSVLGDNHGIPAIAAASKVAEKDKTIENLQKQAQSLGAQLEEKALKLQETEKAKALVETNLTRANEQIAQKIQEIETLKSALEGLSETEKDQKIEELESEIESLKKEAADQKQKKEKFQLWLNLDKEKLAEKDEIIASLQRQINELNEKFTANNELAAASAHLKLEPKAEKIDIKLETEIDEVRLRQLTKLVRQKLKGKPFNLNKSVINGIAEAIGFLENNSTVVLTLDDLIEHFKRSGPTIRRWLKELKSLGLITIGQEETNGKSRPKMVPKLIPSAIKVAVQETEKLELESHDVNFLKLTLSNSNGLTQKEISKKLGIDPSDVSRTASGLEEIGLITRNKIGNAMLVKPVMEKIREHFPELLPEKEETVIESGPEQKLPEPEIKQDEKAPPETTIVKPMVPETMVAVEAVESPQQETTAILENQQLVTSAIETETDDNLNTENDDGKLIIVEGLSQTQEEINLYDVFKNSDQIEKGLNEMIDALRDGKMIKANIFGSHCKIKKVDLPTFVLLLSRKINTEAKRKNIDMEPPIKAIMIHCPEDYEKTEIEINPKIEAKPKLQKSEKPGKLLKTIEQLCSTPGLCDAQKKMLIELNKSGGALDKKELQSKTKLPASTFERYIQYMEQLRVISTGDKQVHLNM